ncbi:hypothetical protein [Nocardia barduliensis]|uniref:hypothetical protein n=1 Tax=Nocardia barduliensis TaxID=2736643 RepID=UPI001571D31F|nr:hypothetical protein [Nocardia barduliensis]
MRFGDRLRLGGSVVALLIAVLLVVPMLDCALHGNDAHRHTSFVSHPGHLAPSAVEHIAHDFVFPPADDCAPHLTHCIVESVLPSAVVHVPPLNILAFAFAVAFVAAAIGLSAVSGVRGPPRVYVPVAGGRATLTKFCIARR